MAVIGEIRKRSGLVLILVGGALVAFILGDAMQNNGPSIQETRVGEVFGRDISNIEFEQRVERQVELQQSGGGVVDEATRTQIRNQVWSQMIRDYVMGPQLEELGLTVTGDEWGDMVSGDNIHPSLAGDPNFKNQQTQLYDRQLALQALGNLEQVNPPYYANFRSQLMQDRMYTKYNNLIKKGLYATRNEAVNEYKANGEVVKFSFVVKKYTDIADSLISYTDADIQAYYDAHKDEARFKQRNETRGIEYVMFEMKPALSDSNRALENLKGTVYDNLVANDYVSDSAYVSEVTEDINFNGYTNYTSGDQVGETDSMIIKADSGAVVGPYLAATGYQLTKVYGWNDRPSQVQARHILLNINDGDTAATETRMDSIKRAIERGADFAEMAKSFSDGPSGPQGGDLGYFGEGQMVPAFNDACFEGQVGDMPIVITQFGVHLIEIQDQKRSRKTLNILAEIEASDATSDSIFSLASAFAVDYDTEEKFISGAEEMGYTRVPIDNLFPAQQTIPGVPNSRRIVSWAFGAEKGETSETFDLGSVFVVARLTKVRPEGVAALEDIRPNIENAVKKQKKAEMFMTQMGGMNDLQAIADKVGSNVLPADNISFSSLTIPGGGGNEPAVIGKIFTLNPGEISTPLEGEVGVYVVQMESRTPAAEPTDAYASSKTDLMIRMASRVDFEVFAALQEWAGVKDERSKLY